MSIYQIALNNLKRRKTKTAYLILGLLVGVATVIAIFSVVRAMRLELGNKLDEFGANIVITPQSEGIDLNYGGTHVSEVAVDVQMLTAADIPVIRGIEDAESINIISPKLVGAVTADRQKVLLVGVDSKREFTMKPWFSLKSLDGFAKDEQMTDLALLDLPENGVLLGAKAAKTLGKNAGDTIIINDRPLQVTGILNELGSVEDGLIFANLASVQNMLGRPGEFSMIEISAYCNFCPIEDIVAQLTEALPNGRVTPLRQAALVREETIDRFSLFGYALSGIVLLVAALVVLTTMMSSVNERTREIGIFRALGFRKFHVAEIIVLEALFISLIAGAAGFVLGNALARFTGPYLAQMDVNVPWDASLLMPALGIAAGLAVIASLYPAVRAAKLDPATALRFI